MIIDSGGDSLQKAQEALHKSVPARGPLLVLLSGGSCLTLLTDKFFAKLPAETLISVLDERFSSASEESNAIKLSKIIPADNERITFEALVPMSGELIEEFTNRIKAPITNWITKYPNTFVLATLGIGSDGHTAGILPNSHESQFDTLFEQKDLIGYVAGDQFPGRVTVTLPFLRSSVSEAIVYAVGSDKQQALKMLVNQGSLHQYPCRVLLEMKSVRVYTDQL